jgi:hypothetical protein
VTRGRLTGHWNHTYLKKAFYSPDEQFVITGQDPGAAVRLFVHAAAF